MSKISLDTRASKTLRSNITIERTMFGENGNDQFTVRVAEDTKEIKALLEVGFEYVCQKDRLIFLRKRK